VIPIPANVPKMEKRKRVRKGENVLWRNEGRERERERDDGEKFSKKIYIYFN
jgi:hypothetical protein